LVQVVTPAGTSNPAVAEIADAGPALFLLDSENRRYAVAQHGGGMLVVRADLFQGNPPGRPATVGEEIVLWGSGFGPTSPAVPYGFLLPAPAPLANPAALAVTIGGKPVAVRYAGMTVASVYQINVVAPEVAAGDQAVAATLAAKSTQLGVYITVGS
jgi:uncharacterized protein (TIGR03437 family)